MTACLTIHHHKTRGLLRGNYTKISHQNRRHTPAVLFCHHRRTHQPHRTQKLAAEMAAGDFSRVIADALAQVEAGAQVLDVNAGKCRWPTSRN